MKEPVDSKGRHALITGADSGISLEEVELLHHEGITRRRPTDREHCRFMLDVSDGNARIGRHPILD